MNTQITTPIEETLSLSDQVRAIALEGLKYAKDPYDRARYEKLLEVATVNFSGALSLDFENLLDSFQREIGSVTSKLGADAAVINNNGQVLILKRSDDQSWCLPCGWVDVGECPATAAVREVKEETGLDVKAKGYLGISTKGAGKTQNIQHQVNMLVLVELISDTCTIQLSHEHTEFKWIDKVDGINWHAGHDKQAQRIFSYINGAHKIILPLE